MSNNFKNIALGLLALVISGGLVVAGYFLYTRAEVGRYVPITKNSDYDLRIFIVDTKTGIVYFYKDKQIVYTDYVNGSKRWKQ